VLASSPSSCDLRLVRASWLTVPPLPVRAPVIGVLVIGVPIVVDPTGGAIPPTPVAEGQPMGRSTASVTQTTG